MNTDNLFFSLDEARIEIRKRWGDKILRSKVIDNLGGDILSVVGEEPIALYCMSLLAPDHAFDFVESAANYIGCKPISTNYLLDKFVTSNEEKKALMRIRVLDERGCQKYFDLGPMRAEFGKLMKDVRIHDGTLLVDFYKELFSMFHPTLSTVDISEWFIKHKPAAQYYKLLMEHFVCFGVFFVPIDGDSESEDSFARKVMIPAVKEIESKYGIRPILVRPFPKDQNENEDFYWFSYSRPINLFLLKYAKNNNLTLRDIETVYFEG